MNPPKTEMNSGVPEWLEALAKDALKGNNL
jgi:hypothetical protein